MKKYKLIKREGNYRIYEFDKPLRVFPRESYDLEEELKNMRERLKEGYEVIEDSIGKYVIISDAHTHTERLCFLGCQYRKLLTSEVFVSDITKYHISGKLTMMIHGGNSDDVYTDEVYLRQLQILNKELL